MTNLVEKMVDAVTTWPINGRADLIDAMQAALAAIREEYAIMPREATEAAIKKGEDAFDEWWFHDDAKFEYGPDGTTHDIYTAMIEEGEVK